MKSFLNIIAVVMVMICIYYLWNKQGKNEKPAKIIKVAGKPYEVIKYDIDTFEIWKHDTIYKRGRDIYHDTTIHDTLWMQSPIDTMQILQAYFAKNVYKDTINLNDSLGTIIIIDTVTENKIKGRTFTANVKERLVKEQVIVKDPPKNQLYFGVDGTINKTDLIQSAGAGLLYKSKNDKIFKLGVGVSNSHGTVSPFISGGAYWKITIK